MAEWPATPVHDRHPHPAARRPGQGLGQGQVSLGRPARGDAVRRDALQPVRPRQGQVDRHLGRREDARRQGRRSRSPRPGRPSATTATTSPPSRPRPRSRPATRSAPSRSSTRCSRTSRPRPCRWPRARPRSSRAATSARAAAQSSGKPEDAMAAAEVTIEGTYSVPMITHVCLESHGLTAKWEGRGQAHRLGQHTERLPDGQRPGAPIQDPARERHGPHRVHGRRLRLEVRRRTSGASRRPSSRR